MTLLCACGDTFESRVVELKTVTKISMLCPRCTKAVRTRDTRTTAPCWVRQVPRAVTSKPVRSSKDVVLSRRIVRLFGSPAAETDTA